MNHVLTATVNQHLDFVTAQSTEMDATTSARLAFESSAIQFVTALDEGVSANALAKAIKEATAGLSKRDSGLAYTSPAAVGFHSRTGRILLLDDDLEDGFDVRDIQTAVKKLKADVVDDIITQSDSRGDALIRLTAAVKQVELEEEEEGEGDGKGDPKVKDILTLLKAARGPISKAAAQRTGGEDASDEARIIAREIASLLDTILAPESVTVTAAADAPVVVSL